MAKKVYYGDMRLATMEDVQNYVASVIATLNLAPLDYIIAGADGLTRMDLSTGQFSMMLGGVEGSGVFDITSSAMNIGWAGNRALQMGSAGAVQITAQAAMDIASSGALRLGAGSTDVSAGLAGLEFGFVEGAAPYKNGTARLWVNDKTSTATAMTLLSMKSGVTDTELALTMPRGLDPVFYASQDEAYIAVANSDATERGNFYLSTSNFNINYASGVSSTGYSVNPSTGHVWMDKGKQAMVVGPSTLSPVIDTNTSVFGNFSGSGGELPAWVSCITGDANGISRIKVSGTFTLSSSQVGWDKPIISLVNDSTLTIGGYVGSNGPASGFGIQTYDTNILGQTVSVIAGQKISGSSDPTAVEAYSWSQSTWAGSYSSDLAKGSIYHETRFGTGAYAFMSMNSQQLEDGNTRTGIAYLKMGVDGLRNNAGTSLPNTYPSHFEQVINLQTGSPVFAINQTGYGTTDNNYLLRAFLEGSSAAGTEVGTLYGNMSGGSGGGDLPAWASCFSGDVNGITAMKVAPLFEMQVKQVDGTTTSAMRVEHTGVFVGDSQSMTFVNGQGIAIVSGSAWPNRRGIVMAQGGGDILTFIDSNHGSEPTGAAWAAYLSNNGLAIEQTGQYAFGKAYVSEDIQGAYPSYQNYVLVAGQNAAKPVPTTTGVVYGAGGGSGGDVPEWVANIHGDATGINWIRTADKFVLGNIDNNQNKRRLFMLDGMNDDAGIYMYTDGGGLLGPTEGHTFNIVPTVYDGRSLTGQYAFMSADVQLDKTVPDVSAVFSLSTGQYAMCAAYGYQNTSDFPSMVGGLQANLISGGGSGVMPAWIDCVKGDSGGVSSILTKDTFAMGNFNATNSNRRIFTMSSATQDIAMFVGTSGNNGEFLQLSRNTTYGSNPAVSMTAGSLQITTSSTSTTINKVTSMPVLVASVDNLELVTVNKVGSVDGNFAHIGTGGTSQFEWSSCIFGDATGISYIKVSDRFVMSNGRQGIALANEANNGEGVYVWDGSAVATLQDISYAKQGTGVFFLSEGCSVSASEPSTPNGTPYLVISTGMPALMAGIFPTFMYSYSGSVEGNIAGGSGGGSSAGTPFIESDSYGITMLRLSKNGFRMGMVDPNHPSDGTVIPVLEMNDSMGVSTMLVASPQFSMRMNMGGTNYGTYADVLTAVARSNYDVNIVLGGSAVSGVAILSDGDLRLKGTGSWRQDTGNPNNAEAYIVNNNLSNGVITELVGATTVNILAKSGDINLTATAGKINLSPANGVYSTSDVHVQS